jgi:hypothetical protein
MTTDIDERLRAAHARIPEPDEATTTRARARLDAAMAAPARRRRTRWRVAIPVVVLAAAGGAAALALLPARVDSPIIAPPVAEAARACAGPGAPRRCLHALSDVAAAQRVLASGRVFYERNDFTISTTYIGADGRPTARPADAAYVVTRTIPEEMWLAPDGSGRLAYGDERPPKPAGPADERAWRAAGAPDLETLVGPPARWGPKVQEFKSGELDSALLFNSNLEVVLPEKDPLSVLPQEPGELAEFLHDAARKQRPEGPESNVSNTFGTNVTTFLRYPLTPPDLRAALLEVLATMRGARALGTIRDGAGRPAAAIALPPDTNDGMNIIAFDPKTSRLLAEGSSDGSGGVRWNMVYGVTTAAVQEVGNRP